MSSLIKLRRGDGDRFILARSNKLISADSALRIGLFYYEFATVLFVIEKFVNFFEIFIIYMSINLCSSNRGMSK